MTFRYAGITDPGLQREHNEDSLLLSPNRKLFAVFDGVGGHLAGEVASALAASTVESAVSRGASLRRALRSAHAVIRAEAQNHPERADMATTAVAVRLRGRFFRYAWVGDSRLYCLDLRAARITCLTRDHSFVQQQVDAGILAPEEAISHPMANLLTQAVGLRRADNVLPGTGFGWLRRGQILLLCSDGLSAYVPEPLYLSLAQKASSLPELAQSLVDAANAAGGHDNVSVALIRS